MTVLTEAPFNELSCVLLLVRQTTVQARRASINRETVPAKDRIFSIFEEHAEFLKRGKAQKACEFGHLVQIAQTAEKIITYYNVEEKFQHDTVHDGLVLEDHEMGFVAYPNYLSQISRFFLSDGRSKTVGKSSSVPVRSA